MANTPSLGTNLLGPQYYTTDFPYIDLMHQAGFGPNTAGVTLDLDSSGWITSLPAGTSANVVPILANPAGADTAGDRYIVTYDGDGTFQGAFGATISEGSTGRFVLTSSAADGALGFQITSTDSADYVRDIHIVREDQFANFEAGMVWNPQFVEKIENFHTLRFMDMQNTNAVFDANGQVPYPDSTNAANIEWADRPLMTDAHWDKGVPVEAMVQLCNLAGADGWFNMPVNASDDYVRQFATYVRDHLDPGLQVHVEFSNEVWNWGFPQSQYALARDDGFGRWMEWYGGRTAQVGRIWNEVFGESPTGGEDVTGRVHVVYNTQAAWQGLETYGLETQSWYENGVHVRASDYFDEYAVTGYYNFNTADHNVVRSWWSNPDGGFDAAVASLRQEVDGPLKDAYVYHAGKAAEYGLVLTTYESGYGEAAPDETADYQQFLINVQRQPELYEIEMANYQNFKDAGGGLFMNFGIIGAPAKWGSWSALESLYQETSPRYEALTDWNATVAPWYETGRDPSVFDSSFMLSQNGAPTIASNGGGDTATISIAENTTAVTKVMATDPDVGQTLGYSIIGGADASQFTIGASTGALSFVTAPNFELPTDAGGNNVYDVVLQASDGHGGIVTQAIAVAVSDVNEAPVITSNGGGDTATASIAVNTTAVTTVTASDPDVGQTLSYAVIGGADASQFTIGASTGALSFVTAPNVELPTDAGGNNVYDVVVQASDGHGGIVTQAIAVAVSDVNEAPVITSNGGGDTATISIAENTTAVTTVTASDPDVGQTLSYAVIGGADASQFTIGASTGALSFVTAPNFELPTDAGGNNVYDVVVQASDGHGGIVTQAIAVAVSDVNEAPVITSNGGGDTATASIAENTTAVTKVMATDPDVGQTLGYSIIGGADASQFTIGASTGALSFVTAPNFELPTDAGGNNVYDVVVQASDGHGGIVTQAIAVAVSDVNEAPVITSNGGGDTATASIAENTTAVTTVTASDPDVGQTLSYAVVGGADASQFTIGASTGALSFVTAPNFELPTDAGGNNVYDVVVQASDGHGGIVTQAIAVAVTDVNEAPVITSNGGGDTATASIAENTTAVTTVTASDPDVGQTLGYAIIGGADASQFTIGASTGALSFVTAPNFELPTDAGGNNVYDVVVQASDGHGGIVTQAIAVAVTDVNEAPVITSNGGGDTATASIAENTTAVTTVTASDPDVGQTLGYAIIGGADASQFTIGASTGALSFVTAPNFELPTDAGGNNVYDVVVQASDGHGGIVTQAIAVAVSDVNEAPVITSNGGGDTATASIAENTTAVTTVTATDPDVGQTLSYAVIGGADASQFTIGASTGALSFVTAPNFELPTDAGGNNVYDVVVQASDGHGGIDTQAIAVGVQNVVGSTIHGTAGNDLIDLTHTVAGQPFPTAEEDILNGGAGSDTLAGGPGADTFVFDLTALAPAQPRSGVVDHILDYNQGNSGTFNPAEGDTFDFSALLLAGGGQPVGNLVRVTENPSGTAAILQIDRDGAANAARWTTIAQLDGIHTGDGVKVIFDTSQPTAMLTVSGPTHGPNDSGLPAALDKMFSALRSAGDGQHIGNFDRGAENPSGTAAISQINQDGASNVAHWTTITDAAAPSHYAGDWHLL